MSDDLTNDLTATRPPSPLASVIEEASALLQDITPGEWSVAPCSDTDETRDVVTEYRELGDGKKQANWIAEITGDFDFDSDDEAEFQKIEANAKFIAASPRLLRALLDHLIAGAGRREALVTMEEEMDRTLGGAYSDARMPMLAIKRWRDRLASLREDLT